MNIENLRRYHLVKDAGNFYRHLFPNVESVDFGKFNIEEPDKLCNLLHIVTQLRKEFGINFLDGMKLVDEESKHAIFFKRLERSSQIHKAILYNNEVYVDCLENIEYVSDVQSYDITFWLIDEMCVFDKYVPLNMHSEFSSVLIFEDVTWASDFKTNVPIEIRGTVEFKCNIANCNSDPFDGVVLFSNDFKNSLRFADGKGILLLENMFIELNGLVVECCKSLCLTHEDSEVIKSVKGGRCKYKKYE